MSYIDFEVADHCNLVNNKKKSTCQDNVKGKTSQIKPWLNNDCHNAWQKYLHDENYFRRVKSAEKRNKKVYSSKHYKKLLNLLVSDPKSFWNLPNKYSEDRTDIMPKILEGIL